MPKILKRHYLKEKETESLLKELSQKLNFDTKEVLGSKPQIELAETQSARIFIVEGKPMFARLNNLLFPTLVFREILPFLPKIVVDMGAIPHICDGADVMAPGIVRIQGDFDKDDILLVADERHEKPLAIGIALFDLQRMRKLKRGKAAKNIHYVGDKLWNLLKKML
jgi:PUA domain protein